MYVCICHAVTDSQIRCTVEERQIRNLRELAAETGVATRCGRCARCAHQLISDCIRGAEPELDRVA